MMKVKAKPCKDGKHDYYENHGEYWPCSTPYCTGSFTSHCRRCGWYITECPCGAENGADKISGKQRRAPQQKKLLREILHRQEK